MLLDVRLDVGKATAAYPKGRVHAARSPRTTARALVGVDRPIWCVRFTMVRVPMAPVLLRASLYSYSSRFWFCNNKLHLSK